MVPRNTNGVAADGAVELRRAATGCGAITVWLVDDSENFRSLLATLLEDEGGLTCARQFSTAEHLLAALATDSAPDIILLDIRMPGMGGLAAVRPIKELAASTQVLMLTTFGDSLAREQAMNDGATDFLLKSFHVDEIAERIRQAQAKPRPAVLVSSTTIRPAGRASETVRAKAEREQTRNPELGRRGIAQGVAGGCLMRGVNFFRAWLENKADRNKNVEPLIRAEDFPLSPG